MGIRGTVRRNHDHHFVCTNIDTDVIVTDGDQNYEIPVELLNIMERLCLGMKKVVISFDEQRVQDAEKLRGWLHI